MADEAVTVRTPDEGRPTLAPTGGTVSAIPVCSLRCERCGILEPIDRDKCDGPCARWVGEECYIVYGSDDVFCFDCRPPPEEAGSRVNASESASEEIDARQVQMIEGERRDSDSKGKAHSNCAADSHSFLGCSAMRGGLCASPALTERIAEESREESAVMKERRKARKERKLNKPPKGGGDG